MKNYRASSYYDGSGALAGAEAYYNCEDGSVSFDDVGIVADDDNTLTIIFANPIRESSMVVYRCMSIELVNRGLYPGQKDAQRPCRGSPRQGRTPRALCGQIPA